MRWRSERGTVTTMFAVLAIFFFAMVSVVSEGGRKLGNVSRAQDLASEAGRAAAATLDTRLMAAGSAVIDNSTGRARAQAELILAAAGAPAQIIYFQISSTGVSVTVEVRVSGRSWIPGFNIDGVGRHTAQVIDPIAARADSG